MSAPIHLLTETELAELGLLESMLFWPETIPTVREIVDPGFFNNPQNAARFRGLLIGYDSGAFDTTNAMHAVCTAMERRGELEAAGGQAGMAALVDTRTPDTSSAGVIDRARALVPFEMFDHIKHRERPVWPTGVLPEWLERFSEELTESLETPIDMAGAIALGALSVARQGRTAASVNDQWKEPGLVWMIPVAASGQKKSALAELAIEPIRSLERECAKETALEVARDAERIRAHEDAVNSIRRRLADAISKNDPGKKREETQDLDDALKELEQVKASAMTEPRWLTNDATPEALAELLADNDSRISLVSSEGREVFEMMLGRYSDRPNLEVYLRGHAGEDSTTDRKGKPAIRVEKGCLTVFALIQPGVLEDIRSSGVMRTSGALARCVFIYPDSPDTADLSFDTEPISAATMAEYGQRLRALAHDDQKREIRLSPEAREELRDFERVTARRRSEREDGDLVAIHEWGSKLAGLAVRFATLLHEADHAGRLVPETLELETMQRGRALAEWAAGHALFCGAEMQTASGHAGALTAWQYIATHTEGREIALRAIQQGTKNGRLKQRESRERALLALIQRGYIAKLPGKKKRYAVNPEALEQHPVLEVL